MESCIEPLDFKMKWTPLALEATALEHQVLNIIYFVSPLHICCYLADNWLNYYRQLFLIIRNLFLINVFQPAVHIAVTNFVRF